LKTSFCCLLGVTQLRSREGFSRLLCVGECLGKVGRFWCDRAFQRQVGCDQAHPVRRGPTHHG
jgi:hypothetical protein